MIRYALIFIAMVAPNLAIGQSSEKKNAMENLASLVIAKKWCSDYAVNMDTAANLLVAAGLQIDRSPDKEYMIMKTREFEKLMGESGMNAYCSYAYKIFGPGGKIPGLMMKK